MKWLLCVLGLFALSLAFPESVRFGIEDLDPDVLIEGTVHAITGEYLESATDLIVTAPDPLLIQRHYSSGTGTKNPPTWLFSPPVTLLIGKKGTLFHALVSLPSGTLLPLQGSSDPHTPMTPPPDLQGCSQRPEGGQNLTQVMLSREDEGYVLTTPQEDGDFTTEEKNPSELPSLLSQNTWTLPLSIFFPTNNYPVATDSSITIPKNTNSEKSKRPMQNKQKCSDGSA